LGAIVGMSAAVCACLHGALVDVPVPQTMSPTAAITGSGPAATDVRRESSGVVLVGASAREHVQKTTSVRMAPAA